MIAAQILWSQTIIIIAANLEICIQGCCWWFLSISRVTLAPLTMYLYCVTVLQCYNVTMLQWHHWQCNSTDALTNPRYISWFGLVEAVEGSWCCSSIMIAWWQEHMCIFKGKKGEGEDHWLLIASTFLDFANHKSLILYFWVSSESVMISFPAADVQCGKIFIRCIRVIVISWPAAMEVQPLVYNWGRLHLHPPLPLADHYHLGTTCNRMYTDVVRAGSVHKWTLGLLTPPLHPHLGGNYLWLERGFQGESWRENYPRGRDRGREGGGTWSLSSLSDPPLSTSSTDVENLFRT